MHISAIIVAAGSSKRMGSRINKPYLLLKGFPLLYYSISTFLKNSKINEVITVIRKQDKKIFSELAKKYKFKKIKYVFGGKVRQDSVYNGLKAVKKNCNIVLIHDAARPFITNKLVNSLIKNAVRHKAVIPVAPVKETVKRSSDKKFIDATLDRGKLFLAQTPQIFEYNLIMDAYKSAYNSNFYGTDDAMLVEKMNHPVRIIFGDEKNIKVTTINDIKLL